MVYGSTISLLLLGHGNPSITFDVFNRLTRRSLQLSSLLCEYQYPMKSIKEQKNETYIIVKMDNQITENKFSVQIYGSTLGMWVNVKKLSRVVVLAGTTTTKGEWKRLEMVFLDHFWYTLSDTNMHAEGIVCFDINHRNLFFEKFSEMSTNIDCVPLYYLLVCESHFIWVVAIFRENWNHFEKIIWQLKKKEVEVGGSTTSYFSSLSSWKEIAGMSSTNRQLVNLISRVKNLL